MQSLESGVGEGNPNPVMQAFMFLNTLQKQPEEGSPETVINLKIIKTMLSLALFTNAQKI